MVEGRTAQDRRGRRSEHLPHRRCVPGEVPGRPVAQLHDRRARPLRDHQDHPAIAGGTHMSTKNPLADFAPKLVEITEKVLFGDVWERPQLSKRDRSLITCAALVALGKTEQMNFHFPRAIENGVTEDELIELITHLAFYAGWPSAMSAATKAKELFKR